MNEKSTNASTPEERSKTNEETKVAERTEGSSKQVFKVEENKLVDPTSRNQDTVDALVAPKDEITADKNTSSSSEELEFAAQAKNDQPAVGPDAGFSQKVLSSFEEKPLSETEIKENQKKWKKYTEQKHILLQIGITIKMQ